ncbi:MAG: hypothetical protein IKX53_06035 [Bacteroidales bacterium]|nr:hypothetical protein [Bacteroidales bacterium]MBR5019178.1 hypothetical protein [Bacteroidales bacterium]
MKELKKLLVILTVAMVSVMTMAVSCNTPEPEPEPEPEPVLKDYNFDLFVCAVKHGGMSQNKNGTYVRSVPALTADQPRVEFTGKGIDITQDYTLESITKGKYYYQVPQKATGGFVKFHIERNAAGEETVVEDSEVPFKDNTYSARKYTHAWVGDSTTLVIIGTASKATKIIWTKLKDSDTGLSVESEGKFDIALPEGFNAFSTAGLLTYRKSDKKLYYFYLTKREAGQSDAATSVTNIAIINPDNMQVESKTAVPSEVMEETAGSAYGELMQNMIMYDEADNMYVAGLITVDGKEMGILRRIPAGSKAFDASWNGFPNPEGKLLTVQYLGNGKALSYSRDESLGTKIDSKSHFYSIISLSNGSRDRVKFNGADLQYCGGRFSQRSVVVNNKAYIGVGGETEGEAEATYPTIYIYDCKTGVVEKGVELSKGFCFDIIRAMDVK